MDNPWITVLLGFAMTIEVLADMIPWVDHLIHSTMTLIHPFIGMAVALIPANDGAIEAFPFAVIGAVAGLSTHVYKGTKRLGATAGAGGFCSPCISMTETIGCFTISWFAMIFAPIA